MQLVQLSDPQGGVPDGFTRAVEAQTIRKGSPMSRQSKRWSNFLTLAIATAALQFHRRSSDWSNFLTREGVFQMILPANHFGRREECPTGVAQSEQKQAARYLTGHGSPDVGPTF